MIDQLDFICRECPLESCNENSLWCALRFATDPNAAQLKAIEVGVFINLNRQLAVATMAKRAIRKEVRRQYLSDYYQDNRDRKLAAANERNKVVRGDRAEI